MRIAACLMLYLFAGLPMRAREMDTLTLEQAMEAALGHNFDLASGRVRAALPEISLAIEQSDFRWKVRPGFSVQQTREAETVTRLEGQVSKRMEYGALFQVRGEWIGRGEGGDDERVDLRLEQPLFRRFGRLDALRFVDAARHRVNMARWSFHRETENLMHRVVRGYVEVLRQAGRQERETAAVDRAADLVRMVERRKEEGRANAVDLLEMRMAHQEARARLRRAEEGRVQARLALAGLLGRVPEQLPVLEPPVVPDVDIPEVSAAEDLARANRVGLLRVYATYEEARRNLRLQEREFFPDVRLVADYRPVSSAMDEGNWNVGMVAGQELDGASTRLKFDRAGREVQAALLEISAYELRLIREVRSAHGAVRLAELERELAIDRLDIAGTRLRLSRSLYPRGQVTAQQLREAEEAWVDIERERLEADLELTEAIYGFWHALGLMLDGAGEEDGKTSIQHSTSTIEP